MVTTRPKGRYSHLRLLKKSKVNFGFLFVTLVTPAGVEPAIFWMRTRRPNH